MWGHYDDDDELTYLLGGLDLYTRVQKVNLRGEVMFRRTEIPDTPGELSGSTLQDLFVQRDGFYVELDGPLFDRFEWLVRFDGFRRDGAVPIVSSLDSTDSRILRYTGGINVIPLTGIKLKLSYEYWHFTDFPAAQVVHSGLVGTF
jgi:hypothetical protein